MRCIRLKGSGYGRSSVRCRRRIRRNSRNDCAGSIYPSTHLQNKQRSKRLPLAPYQGWHQPSDDLHHHLPPHPCRALEVYPDQRPLRLAPRVLLSLLHALEWHQPVPVNCKNHELRRPHLYRNCPQKPRHQDWLAPRACSRLVSVRHVVSIRLSLRLRTMALYPSKQRSVQH